MANAHAEPQHDYHLVNPSPWPAIGSVSAFVAAVGAILWMHHMVGYAPLILGAGAIGIAYTMFGWWRDVIHEAEFEGDHTRVVQISHRYGMILFIASEVMFFVAWFWAYFNTALFPDELRDVARIAYTGGIWPPKGVETFDPWHLPLLNTLILLTSGTTVTWAHHALLENDRKGLVWGLTLTVALGLSFTCVQAWEYGHASVPLFGQYLRRDVFHGDGLSRRPCHHRLDLSDRLPVPRHGRPVHANAASRLRIRRLVLALRRRGVAVPVRLHLCMGRRAARGLTPAIISAYFRAGENRGSSPLTEGRAEAYIGGMTERTNATLSGAILAGLSCACPRCGRGKLFDGFLTLRLALRPLRPRL